MKYIIEFEDEYSMNEGGMKYHQCKQVPYWSVSHGIIKNLTPYTEPNRKAIEDEVWEFASMLMNMHSDIAEDIYWSMNGGKGIGVAAEMTYQEAKSKYDVWKKGKEKICPGDEIEYYHGDIRNTFVVFEIDKDNWLKGGTLYKGKEWCWETCRMSSATKTGRHFDEVAELLEKMRGEEE